MSADRIYLHLRGSWCYNNWFRSPEQKKSVSIVFKTIRKCSAILPELHTTTEMMKTPVGRYKGSLLFTATIILMHCTSLS